jgi:hypothetical protein
MSVDNNDVTNELNIDMEYAIHERAHDKAFAKVIMLEIEVSDLKRDIQERRWGPISRDEVVLLLDGAKKELLTWNYIATLIEKNDV